MNNARRLCEMGFVECEKGRFRRRQYDNLVIRILADSDVIEVNNEHYEPHCINLITTFSCADEFVVWLEMTDRCDY